MKTAWVVVLMVGCAVPETEHTATQSIMDAAAATYRFTGSLPAQGETCRRTPHYRNSLCGKGFHGYLTIPTTPNPDYASSYFEAPYDESGHVAGPYGLVFNIDGTRPRNFQYAFIKIANDIPDPFGETLFDTFEIGASASYSNDGFYASFIDPTATAIDNEQLMPTPSRFSQVCTNDSVGCAMVVGDAASDIRSLDLHLSRSPSVITVRKEDRDPPYFFVTSTDWSDAGHTTAMISVEIFDDYTFATPTCELWIELQEGEDAPLHVVATQAHHDGRTLRQAMLSIESGAPNSARELTAVNVTCSFRIPGESPVESTSIFYN